jgi:hypothetical protein
MVELMTTGAEAVVTPVWHIVLTDLLQAGQVPAFN